MHVLSHLRQLRTIPLLALLSRLNACVLLRSESINVAPDFFTKFSFAKGLEKVKLGGVC